ASAVRLASGSSRGSTNTGVDSSFSRTVAPTVAGRLWAASVPASLRDGPDLSPAEIGDAFRFLAVAARRPRRLRVPGRAAVFPVRARGSFCEALNRFSRHPKPQARGQGTSDQGRVPEGTI